ncbi:hypothetical protein CRE_12796 [Caenorhabditis remanei]|uniref:Uncharacterized protein n=1 Tax=Caenorhabditis remanei TaxID=31234 RepID=E3M7W7_CAERE|nr:hypothetical protein CRE_12796 [Caenorhabditis remanei]
MSWAVKARSALTPNIWFTKKSGAEDGVKQEQHVIVRSMDSDVKPEEGCWPELKEFCRAHVIECSAFGLFLLFGFFCIFNAFGFLGTNELKLRYAHYEELVNEHCQFVENRNLHGSEGKTNHPNATLASILAVVRHGDRYGLVGNEKDCQVLTEEENQEFDEYLATIEKQNLKSVLKIPENMENKILTPKKDKCDSSTLSPRGAIQEFSMGRFLSNQYRDTSLFSTSETYLNVTLTFSRLQRTFASGVALISGFIERNQTEFELPIEFKEGSVYYGCTDSGCNCDETIEILQQMTRTERKSLFRLEVDEHTQHVAQKLLAEKNYTQLNMDPTDIIDNLVARYACQRKPLPCNDEFCASYLFFGDIFEYFSKQSEKLFDLNMGAERQYRVLNSFPILRYVRLMTESNGKQIQFFASHDTIIGSILRVLTDSGKYIDWQVFAARLIFEIYETTENTKFLRVVYDGEDITTSVKFCKNLEYGLCPVSDLKLFMEKGIFEMAGFETFEQICTDHRKEFNFV